MATLHEEITTILSNDATLSALLTGGIFNADTIDQKDVGGVDWVPKDGNGRMLPHAVVRWRDSVAFQSNFPQLGAEREAFEVYVRDYVQFGTINQACGRIKLLLHDIIIYDASDHPLANVLFEMMSGGFPDQSVSHAPTRFVRFGIRKIRS